ncbi:hypothetical protein F01_420926 [Burkholderia cenocepacia]|nr:hypothetical protein F01_420926 [Burkholderia cenocepacia]
MLLRTNRHRVAPASGTKRHRCNRRRPDRPSPGASANPNPVALFIAILVLYRPSIPRLRNRCMGGSRCAKRMLQPSGS